MAKFSQLGEGIYNVRILTLHGPDVGAGHPDPWHETSKIVARVGVQEDVYHLSRELWDLVTATPAGDPDFAPFPADPPDNVTLSFVREGPYNYGAAWPPFGLGAAAPAGVNWARRLHHASKFNS